MLDSLHENYTLLCSQEVVSAQLLSITERLSRRTQSKKYEKRDSVFYLNKHPVRMATIVVRIYVLPNGII